MNKTIAEKQLDHALILLGEAIRNVRECEIPDDATRLAALMYQCDVVRAAALARASEIEFRRIRSENK